MKKFLIIVGVVTCLAFAAPTMAKTTVSGMLTTDIYYLDQSSERSTPNGQVQNAVVTRDDFNELNIYVPQAHNRLIVRYKSDDEVMTGYMQIRGGGSNGGNALDWKYAWLDWRPNNMFHLRVGRQPQAFAVMTAGAANMGFHDNFTLLTNYGNIQITDADSIKAYVKFSDMIRMELQFEDPRGNALTAASVNAAHRITALPATNRSNPNIPLTEQNTLPKIDFALPITIANFTIEPSATWPDRKSVV